MFNVKVTILALCMLITGKPCSLDSDKPCYGSIRWPYGLS